MLRRFNCALIVPIAALGLSLCFIPGRANAKCEPKGKAKDGSISYDELEGFSTTLGRTGKLKSGKFMSLSRCKNIKRRTEVDVVLRSACKWWGDYYFKVRFTRSGHECFGWISSGYLRLKGKTVQIKTPAADPPAAPEPAPPGEPAAEPTAEPAAEPTAEPTAPTAAEPTPQPAEPAQPEPTAEPSEPGEAEQPQPEQAATPPPRPAARPLPVPRKPKPSAAPSPAAEPPTDPTLMPGTCGKKGKEKSFFICELPPFHARVHNVKNFVNARDSQDRGGYYTALKVRFAIPKGAKVEVFRRTTKKAPVDFRKGGTGRKKTTWDYAYKVAFQLEGQRREGWVHGVYLYPLPGSRIARPAKAEAPQVTFMPGTCGRTGKEKSIPYCDLTGSFEATIYNVKTSVNIRDSRDLTGSYFGFTVLFSVPRDAKVEVFRRSTKKAPGSFREGGYENKITVKDYMYKLKFRDQGRDRYGWVHGYFLKPIPGTFRFRPEAAAPKPKPKSKNVARKSSSRPSQSATKAKSADCRQPKKAGELKYCSIKTYQAQITGCHVLAHTSSLEPSFGVGMGSVVDVYFRTAGQFQGGTWVKVKLHHQGRDYNGWIREAHAKRLAGPTALRSQGPPTLSLKRGGADLRDVFGRFKLSVQGYTGDFKRAGMVPPAAPVEVIGQSERTWKCVFPYYQVEYFDYATRQHRRVWVKSLTLLEIARDPDHLVCRDRAGEKARAQLKTCGAQGASCFFKAMWSEYARCLAKERGWGAKAPALAQAVARDADRCLATHPNAPEQCSDVVQAAFQRAFRAARAGR